MPFEAIGRIRNVYGEIAAEGGGGEGFRVGPPDNIFGDTGETGDSSAGSPSINPAPDRATAEATRDTYFTANLTNLATYDAAGNEALGIYLYYEDNGTTVIAGQTRLNSAWRDNRSVQAIRGETGAAGATGNSYFFSSETARDAFFNIVANRALLEHDLPIMVNENGNSSPFSFGHHFFYLQPGETREFIVANDGTNQLILPCGPIVYNFEITGPASFSGSGNISGWTIQGSPPAGLIEIPSGNTDRVQYKIPGTAGVDFETRWDWFGATTTVTVDGETLWDNDFDSPNITVDLNGSLNNSSQSTGLLKINGYSTFFNDRLINVTVSADDYLTYQGTNLSSGNSRGLSPRQYVTYTVKAA